MEYKLKYYSILVLLAFSWCSIEECKGVKISPDKSELVIGINKNLTLNCTDDGPVRWIHARRIPPESPRVSNKEVQNEYNFSTLIISPTRYQDTGYYICQSLYNGSDKARIYIYSYDEENVIFTARHSKNASTYDEVIIPCLSTLPNVSVYLTKSGTPVEPLMKYNSKVGFVVSTYPVISGSINFTCKRSNFYNDTTGIQFNLYLTAKRNGSSRPHIEVTDSDSNYPIMENRNATMNCSIVTPHDLRIKSINWDFPKHVAEKILVEDLSEIRHDNISTYFRILNIFNSTKNDQGNYTCTLIDGNLNMKQITHSLNVISSNSTFVNITVAEESRKLTVREGTYFVEFTAIVYCFPKCKITWYHHRQGHEVTEQIYDEPFYEPKWLTTEDEEHQSKLKINRIGLEDFGTYRIEAINAYHKKNENFSLIVEGWD